MPAAPVSITAPTPAPSTSTSSKHEQFNTEPDESMTLADLYSRMPPPPPRPPSVASLSSRTSNNNRPLSSVSLASSYQTQSNPAYGLTPPSPRVAMEMAQRDRDSKHSLLNEEQRQSWQSLTQSKDVSVSARSSLRRSLSNDASGNSSGSSNRRRTSRRDNDLKGIGIERVPLPSGLSTSSSLTSGLTLPESSPSVKDQSRIAKKDEINLRNKFSGGIEGVKKFVVDLGNAILMLLMGFIWPALLSLLGSLTPIPQTPSRVSPLPSKSRPLSTAASSTASPAAGPGSLAERFKYAICTSFLLAPSISISFYDDAPPLVNDPDADAEAEAEIETYAKRKIGSNSSANQQIHSSPSSQDERTQAITSCVCRSLNATLPPSPSTFILISDKSRNPNSISSASNLPTLTPLGSQLRTSSMIACIAYRFLTSSWEAWFQAVLLLSCLVWSVYLTPSLGLTVASEDQLRFSLSLAPQPELLRSELGRKAQAYVHPGSPPRSLLRYAIPGRLTPRDKATLASEAVKSARDLVLAAHAFDRSVNAGIGAIQEVELVARGYKITHPLPPISRIEAGSSSLGAYHSSPPRSRSPYGSAPPNGSTSHQDARLSNASAFSLTSGKKQHSRPMSFSGLPSPAGLGEGEAQSFASQQEPRRLAGLRNSTIEVLSSADRICRTSKSQLSSLVEKEELGLLSEMYSLDGSSNGDGLTHSASVGSSLADNNGRSEHQQPSSDVEELEDNRISWSSGGGGRGVLGNNWQTTPRNFGSSSKRISLLNESPFDLSHPPSVNNSKQKRLSLLSDGSAADREKERERGSVSPVPPGTRSNRNSLLLDSTTSPKIGSSFGGSIGKRGSRLGYVSDGVSKAGPNESAASKRLSYTSSTNGSNPIRSNYSPSATASFGDTSATSIATGTGTQDTSVSGKRLSLLGLSPNAPFNTESTSPARSAMAPTPSPLLLDPQSLLSLKSNFESFHSTRRRTLCHLLALDFTLSDKVTGGEKEILDMELQEYWDTVLQSMQDMIRCFEDQKIIIDQQVKSAFDLCNETGATAQKSGLLAPPGQSESGTSKGAFGHMGLEDRIGVMAVSLRALQSKLSACSEDLHLKSPSHLHGDSTSSSSLSEAASSKAEDSKSSLRNDAELSAKQDQVERVFESIQEELLSLSAEWEAGLKILKREKVRAVSPSLPEHLRPSSATRGLDSPQEVEEDALNSNKPWRKSDSTSESSDGPPDPPSGHSLYSLRRLEGKDGTSETLVPSNLKSITNETGGENGLDEEMSDLAQLLLNSTSPDHLPPPGLEQVFESIAGMADSNFKKDNLSKMTREERIKKAKEQRAAALIQQNAKREKANREESEGVEPLGMVRELKDVIKARRESRLLSQSTNTSSHSGNVEQHQQQQQPSSYEQTNSNQHQSQIQLGSPLELESNGTFSSNSASISSILSAKLAASSGSNSTSASPPSSTLQSQDQSPVITSSPTNSNASRSRPRKSSETANRNRQSVVMDTQVMNNKVWRHSQDLLNGFNRESLDQNSRDHSSQTNANP